MMQRAPQKLYRYRPLDDALMERELAALRDSYLHAPPFAAMNDPMEAFYETGGVGDTIVNAILAQSGKNVSAIYATLSDLIGRFALVSFAGSHENLPMWAYYASNFGGMCLEFEKTELAIGDLRNEELKQVTYARSALPPLSFADVAGDRVTDALIDRLTRKRSEWTHENEWRFICGEVGRKHYPDDALTRVFLGPRISTGHAAAICKLMDRRPTEVLQGEIRGFELKFRSIKPARPLEECDRVGAGIFDPSASFFCQREIEDFLSDSSDSLANECRRIATRPNFEKIADVHVSEKGTLCVHADYRMRDDRIIYYRHYFDRKLNRALSA